METLRKIPMKIRLRPGQVEALQRLALQQHVSVSELVRRGVDLLLKEQAPENDPLLGIIGLGRSGISDLSENHDRYLVEIYKQESQRS